MLLISFGFDKIFQLNHLCLKIGSNEELHWNFSVFFFFHRQMANRSKPMDSWKPPYVTQLFPSNFRQTISSGHIIRNKCERKAKDFRLIAVFGDSE